MATSSETINLRKENESKVQDQIQFQATHTAKSEPKEGIIILNEKVTILLGQQSLHTIMIGLNIMTRDSGILVNRDWFRLMFGLALIANRDGEINGEIRETAWVREDIEHFRSAVLARMAHCEGERDGETGTFNPDSYIEMKHLLLDLQLWLTATVISYK